MIESVEEVKRLFKEIGDFLTGTSEPEKLEIFATSKTVFLLQKEESSGK